MAFGLEGLQDLAGPKIPEKGPPFAAGGEVFAVGGNRQSLEPAKSKNPLRLGHHVCAVRDSQTLKDEVDFPGGNRVEPAGRSPFAVAAVLSGGRSSSVFMVGAVRFRVTRTAAPRFP